MAGVCASVGLAGLGTWLILLGDGDSGDARSPAQPPGSAAVIDCSAHVEGNGPIPAPDGDDDIVAGPISFAGLRGKADAPDSHFRRRSGERFAFVKSGAVVRAGAAVTVAVAPRDERVLRLDYPPPGEESNPAGAVTFRPCDPAEPAFSYDGVVGARTGFAGGFLVRGQRCARIQVWVAGPPEPIPVEIGFGRPCRG